jgi:hypothetical protein
MSEPSMYVADELMEYWPFLPRSARAPKIETSRLESTESLCLVLHSKAKPSPVLAWMGSGGEIVGRWRATISHG